MNFHPEQFINNLSYMGIGMLAIFIVIGLLIGVTLLLSRIFSRKKDNKKADGDGGDFSD